MTEFAASANAGITFKLGPHAHALFNPRASELGLSVRKGAWHPLVVALAPAVHTVLAQLDFKAQALVDVMPQLAASEAQDDVGHCSLAARRFALIMTFFLTVM